MSKMDALIKDVNKQFKEDIATRGVKRIEFQRIPLTSPRMNYCLYGGIPRNCLIEFAGEEGSGKALVNGTPVLTKFGWKPIEKLNIGDLVYGEDGKLHNVIGVYPQGYKQCSRITFSDGVTVDCSDDHLWQIQTESQRKKKNGKFKIRTTSELANNIIQNQSIPIVAPIEYSKKDLPLDPYFLGLMLGDGSFRGGLTFTNTEIDLIDWVANYVSQFDCTLVQHSANPIQYRINENKKSNDHPIKHIIKELGLYKTYSHNKFIPDIYKYSSIEDRYRLLAGLINTDGSIEKATSFKWESVSTQLYNDVIEVARSLGLYVTGRPFFVDIEHADKGFDVEIGQRGGRCHARLPKDVIPLLSEKHKKCNPVEKPKTYYRKVVDISSIGEKDCTCIKVDSPSHLFVAKDFIVTHNTTTALDVCKAAQKIFKDEFENSLETVTDKKQLEYLKSRGEKKVLYVDAENTMDEDWARLLGVNVDDMYIVKPQTQAAEEIFEIIVQAVETDEIGLVILDSLGVLMSQSAFDKDMTEKTMAGISAPLTLFSKKMVMACRKYDCTFIGINQLRDDMSGFGRKITPGGRGWKFNCSLRVFFEKGDYIDNTGSAVKKSEASPAGNKVVFSIAKTKAFKPDRKLGSYTLFYDYGIDPIVDTVEMAIQLDIVHKAGAWFSIVDTETGEMIADAEGNEIKIQGQANLLQYLSDNEELYEEVNTMVQTKLS